MLMGRKKAGEDLSRKEWIDFFFAMEWRLSKVNSIPHINLEGYNIFYKENPEDSWSFCVKRMGSP